MKRKFKQWLSLILPISTKRTRIYDKNNKFCTRKVAVGYVHGQKLRFPKKVRGDIYWIESDNYALK
jgi:hypothetical protein